MVEEAMIKSHSGRFMWWLHHGAIKYAIVIIVVLTFSYFKVTHLLWLIIGAIFVFFNKQAYEYMIKYSSWLSKRIGQREILKAIKTTFYKRFYRTAIFIVGLMLLDLGISGGETLFFILDKFGLA